MSNLDAVRQATYSEIARRHAELRLNLDYLFQMTDVCHQPLASLIYGTTEHVSARHRSVWYYSVVSLISPVDINWTQAPGQNTEPGHPNALPWDAQPAHVVCYLAGRRARDEGRLHRIGEPL